MKKVVIILFCFIGLLFEAQNLTFDWAKPIGGIYDEYGSSIAVDKNGDIYSSGTFQGTVDFSPVPNTFTLVSLNGLDVFVTKHSASGNLLWAKSFGSTLNENVSSIVTDTTGNLYITGSFKALCDFDPGPSVFTLTPVGNSDIFIVKLDASGNFLWAKQIGGLSFDESSGIATSIGGDIHITGYFNNTVDFDPNAGVFNLTSNGGSDIFVLKLSSGGNFVWAQKMGGTDNDKGSSIDIDKNGNVFITGGFKLTVDFDPSSSTSNLSSAGFQDAFVLKLNASGNFVWVKQFEGGMNDDEQSRSLKIDTAGNVCLTGSYGFTVDFDPGAGVNNLTSTGLQDVYVVKLSTNGNFVWAKSFGSTGGNDNGNSINIDKNNTIYCGGNFYNNVDFDPGPGTYTLNASSWGDGFITKLASNGNFIYAMSVSGIDEQVIGSISIDTLNNIYATGFFETLTDFDPGTSVFSYSATGRDAFLLKLSPCIIPSSAVNTANPQNQLICTGNTSTLTASAATGTLSWYSSPSSTTSLGTGAVFVTPTLSTGTYTYYVEVETCTTSISRTAITLTVSACAGISQMNIPESLAVSVYPNPSSGEFFVSTQTPFEYEVIDLQGKIIKTGNFNSGANVLELNNITSGMYFLKCFDNRALKPIKLIVN